MCCLYAFSSCVLDVYDYFYSYFKDAEYPEVFYPNVFTYKHPWGDNPVAWPEDAFKDMKVPIFELSHVTHNVEAHAIRRERYRYVFNVNQKLGKDYGESFQPWRDKFVQILPHEAVFPGFYSWWGIHPSQSFRDRIAGEVEVLDDDGGLKVYVPNYLKAEPESFYGNNAFISKFQDLLMVYGHSRGSDNLYIRKGGTLQYFREICYVLIICTGGDRKELEEFDPLTPKSPPFLANGLINERGKITDPTAIATFLPEYVVTWSVDKEEGEPGRYNYETVAFAFYFPNRDGSMQVVNCKKVSVSHRKDFCVKKQLCT